MRFKSCQLYSIILFLFFFSESLNFLFQIQKVQKFRLNPDPGYKMLHPDPDINQTNSDLHHCSFAIPACWYENLATLYHTT